MIPIDYSRPKTLLEYGAELELSMFAMTNSTEYNGASISDHKESVDFYDVILMHQNIDGRGLNEPLLEFENLSEAAANVLVDAIGRELDVVHEYIGPG